MRFSGKDRTAFAFFNDMDSTNSNELDLQTSLPLGTYYELLN